MVPDSEDGQISNLAMVALKTAQPVLWREVVAHLRAGWPTVNIRGEVADDTAALAVEIPGGGLGLSYLPMPIPWADLDWPVRAAWQWPEAEAALRDHKAHVVVFAGSHELTRIELNLLLTRTVASVVAISDAAGVYYGNASLVISPERYLEETRQSADDQIPMLLWIGFHPVPGQAGVSAFTTGMEMFNLLNLEANDTALRPAELLGILADVASYEIAAGVQIADGETVGPSEEERIPVSHGPSRYGSHEVTCRLLL